jgi:uncharacterized protein (TIGR02001 family)
MFKNKLLNTLILAALSAPGLALAEDAPASANTFTSNVGLTSDYTFRGISQNMRSLAVQGGFDYAHASGMYAGTWASNVSGNQYNNASLEWDLYGGYNGKVNDDLAYNAGVVSVIYPNANTAFDGSGKNYDTTEVQFGGTYLGVNVAYHYALTNWFGISSEAGGFNPVVISNGANTTTLTSDGQASGLSSKGSSYLEINYTYTFAGDAALLLHAGRQTVQNFGLLSYADYKIGLSKPLGGFTFAAAYTATNATDNSLYHIIGANAPMATKADKDLRNGNFALSLSRSF